MTLHQMTDIPWLIVKKEVHDFTSNDRPTLVDSKVESIQNAIYLVDSKEGST